MTTRPGAAEERLDELERYIEAYGCPCGSGGAMACDDDCHGDQTPWHVREALRLILAELRERRRRSGAGKGKGT